MKKLIKHLVLVCILFAVTSGSVISAFALEDDESEIIPDNPTSTIKGDVNLDGKLDIADATLLQKYSIKVVTFNSNQEKLADFNGDGKIDIRDITEIQKKLLEDKKDCGVIEMPIIPVK